MVLLGKPDSGPYTPVAVWPDAKLSMQHLTGAAERSLKERRGLLVEKDPDPDRVYHCTFQLFPVSKKFSSNEKKEEK